MSRESKKKIFGGMIKLIGILIGFYIASYAWFNSNEETRLGNIEIGTDKFNKVYMSIDEGTTWDTSLDVNITNNFKFSNEVTSDGVSFYKAANKRDDGTPISFRAATANSDYFEFNVWFKAEQNSGIFLDQSSSIEPEVGTGAEVLIGNTALNISGYGPFSKDLIAGGVRVAFIKNDLVNDEYVPKVNTQMVWAPNKGYEIVYSNDSYSAYLNSSNIQNYNYVDPTEQAYYVEKRVPNIKDNLRANDTTFNAYGDPTLVYINNDETPNDIEVMTIRIWVEGNDRDAISALKGGNFIMKMKFVSIMKEPNTGTPMVTADTTDNIINDFAEGMEYSIDYGNNWIGYDITPNPQFDSSTTVWVRYIENATRFASEKTILSF